MTKTKKRTKGGRHQLTLRATPAASNAKEKLITILKEKGIYISESDLLRGLLRPCFVPHKPPAQQSWCFNCFGPMRTPELRHYLTPRFRAWAEPLIQRKEATIDLDQLANGMWMLWVWVSNEYAFLQKVRELEEKQRKRDKAKSGKVPDETMTLYLSDAETCAARTRARPLGLKRTRKSGESRMLRLVASYALPGFLKYLETQEALQSGSPPISAYPNLTPEEKTSNPEPD